MSSFLMNASAGVYGVGPDPKFPPSEEYNQSSYIPATDYYGVHSHHHQQHQHVSYGSVGHAGYVGHVGHVGQVHQSAVSGMGYYGQHSGYYASSTAVGCGMVTPSSKCLIHDQKHVIIRALNRSIGVLTSTLY